MSESFLDFLIRHQFPLLFTLSASIAIFSIFTIASQIVTKRMSDAYSYRDTFSYGRYRVRSQNPNSDYILVKPYFWIILGLLVVTGLFFYFRSEPVPKAIELNFPPRLRNNAANSKLLLFIHGWSGDAVGTWQKFPSLVLADPKFSSYDITALSYPTYLLRRDLSLSEMASWINENLTTNGSYTRYKEISIIAHSMGGIVAREIIIHNRLMANNTTFKTLVEIGTPHEGADLARIISTIGISENIAKDIAPNSQFLRDLRDHWNALAMRPATYCISSPDDAVVSEQSAIAQCDRFLYYPQWGHIELIKPEDRNDTRYLSPMSRLATLDNE